MFSKNDVRLTKEGSILEILHSARFFCNSTPHGLYDNGEAILAEMVTNIQSNTNLMAEACSKKIPLDSLIDVVLALFLQVAVVEYQKKSSLENLHESGLPLHIFVDVYRESISKYRGNSHVMLFKEDINREIDRLYGEPGFYLQGEINTPGERMKIQLLASKIRVVKERLAAEIAVAAREKKFESAVGYIRTMSREDLEALIARTKDAGAKRAIEKVFGEKFGTSTGGAFALSSKSKPGGVFSFCPSR